MSEVSLLITTNRKFYVEGNVDDIIYQIQREPTDPQTGKPSKWFYFHRLTEGRVLAKHQSTPAMGLDYIPCWEVGKKTAIKKTAIKSVAEIQNGWQILTPEEVVLVDKEVCAENKAPYSEHVRKNNDEIK